MLEFTKYSLREALNDSKGKSSLGLLFGFLYGTLSIIMYITGLICIFINVPEHSEIFTSAFALTGVAGTLIGIRRFTKDKTIELNGSTHNSNSSSTGTELH
jgi:hypothetical protein